MERSCRLFGRRGVWLRPIIRRHVGVQDLLHAAGVPPTSPRLRRNLHRVEDGGDLPVTEALFAERRHLLDRLKLPLMIDLLAVDDAPPKPETTLPPDVFTWPPGRNPKLDEVFVDACFGGRNQLRDLGD